ncbi:MAG: TIM barrel protein [Chloroflexota bacterium]|nr:TIM barrel protein [Chloroflexota bacterium]
MQLALSGRSLGVAHPIEEDIRIAAITGYPWLVVDQEKMESFLEQREFTIRDLKRLFLRTQPAAVDALYLPDSAPKHISEAERICKDARRVGAPVVVARIEKPDERIVELADVAEQWSSVLALAPSRDPAGVTFGDLRHLIFAANHPALGLYVDLVALWRTGDKPRAEDAERTVLLAVSDVDEEGLPVLPGTGTVPLPQMLAPLYEGGYDSVAVLAMEGRDVPREPEAFAGAGLRALSDVLREVGWVVE